MVHRDDVGEHHDEGSSTWAGEAELLTNHLGRATAVFVEQVADREGASEHDPDVARDLNGSEQLFLIGEHRVETPDAEVLHEEPGEVLDDGQREDDLDEGVHDFAEHQEAGHHEVGFVTKPGCEHEAENEEGRQELQARDEVQCQVMQCRRIGRDHLPHWQIEGGDHHQRSQYCERNADQTSHRTECEVLVIFSLQHHQADRDQVDDGGT
ncbi:hypothetical protein D3C81_1440030 [compost metagenome]